MSPRGRHVHRVVGGLIACGGARQSYIMTMDACSSSESSKGFPDTPPTSRSVSLAVHDARFSTWRTSVRIRYGVRPCQGGTPWLTERRPAQGSRKRSATVSTPACQAGSAGSIPVVSALLRAGLRPAHKAVLSLARGKPHACSSMASTWFTPSMKQVRFLSRVLNAPGGGTTPDGDAKGS